MNLNNLEEILKYTSDKFLQINEVKDFHVIYNKKLNIINYFIFVYMPIFNKDLFKKLVKTGNKVEDLLFENNSKYNIVFKFFPMPQFNPNNIKNNGLEEYNIEV